MRKILSALTLAVALPLAGCHVTASTPSTPPAGAIDAVDGTASVTLRTLHAAVLSIDTDVMAGRIQLTASQLSALNTANRYLNAADRAEITYHMTPTSANGSTLSNAVAAANSGFASLQTSLAASLKPQ
jgi:type IV pilus biogenesis protein CpaD/CtpE